MNSRLNLSVVCLLTAFLSPPLTTAQNLVVNVESYGAQSDSYSDNSGPISQAMAAMHAGQTLYFPCTRPGAYNISSPINFARLSGMQIRGASKQGCGLVYVGSGAQSSIYSFVGASNIEVTDLSLNVFGTAQAPQTVVLLGRTGPSAYSGSVAFNNVTIDGYASKALVYSIGSEQNTWMEPTMILRGGGASYVFYTSSVDDLGVASLPTVSNLSVWMQNFVLIDSSSASASGHSLIYDVGYSSAAGNHTYRDGYFASGSSGRGMTIYAAPGSVSWMALTIDSIRFENGGDMFYLAGGGSFGDISITNSKADGPSTYLINLPTSCTNCTFQANSVGQGHATASLFGTLRNSHVSENYPFTVGTAINSFIEDRTSGIFQLGSPTGSAVACAANNEGAMQYLKGGNGSDGLFRICQYRSGNFNWVTH